jgi:hypothetical protein
MVKQQLANDPAGFALEGMPVSGLATALMALEKLYKQQSDGPFLLRPIRQRRAIRILREQIHMLALEYARLQNSRSAAEQQAELYKDFVKVIGIPREFAMFLKEHFPNTWVELSENGLPHTRIAEQIMLRLKDGKPVG